MRRRRPLAALILLLIAACGGDDGERRASERTPPPTSRARVTVSSPAATASATAAPTPAGTAAAPPGCRNSTEERCGRFRFDPGTDNARLVVDASFTPAAPKAGDRVTFTLRASDADAREVRLGTYEFTESGPGKVVRGDASSCTRAYGPWDPPAAQRGTTAHTLSHTYEEAGTFEATFIFTSRSYEPGSHPWPHAPPGDEDGDCIDPYASVAKADLTIQVR